MTTAGRRVAICAQPVRLLSGIDFVQVVDPADQRVLRVFFVIDPDLTVPPIVAPALLPALAPGVDEGPAVALAPGLTVRVETASGQVAAAIDAVWWRRVRSVVDTRVALEIAMVEPGGFEPYRLVLGHAQLDPLSNTLLFDFKQACETGFDCESAPACPPPALVDVDIDYLARDFHSLRRALLDFTAVRYPDWKEPIEADVGAMLMEVMAALGDHFAYQQDRIDAETRFKSATQRASVAAHAKLVDYRPGRGLPARGPVRFTAIAGGVLPADTRAWARVGGEAPLVFSTLAALWVHPFWNERPLHRPDPLVDCLPCGTRSLLLRSAAAVAAQTPAGVTRAEFLVGKRVLILSDPADPALPRRCVPVTITGLAEFSDPLVLDAGLPTFVTEIRWSREEALAFELPCDGLSVAMNVVQAAAGERVVEYLRIGDRAALSAHHGPLAPELEARMAGLVPAVEREGPLVTGSEGRDIVFRHGLAATEQSSLRHFESGLPDLDVTELLPPPALPLPLPVDDAALFGLFLPDPAASWSYVEDLLTGDLDSEHYTLEPGLWRTVLEHPLPFGQFPFRDYAGNGGWTLRFASGGFGRAPRDGAVLRASYRTDPGVLANVPSQALSLTPPAGVALDPVVAALVSEALNPLPLDNAQAPESLASIKINAPEAFRARPRRAVRLEDYASILALQPFVQRAHAVSCWTGSWSTDFVAVDPHDAVALTEVQRGVIEHELDCIRLATRDVRYCEADYLDIDLDVVLCVAPDAHAGEVVAAVKRALRPPGFFDPERFTLGSPLVRSALEAAVQAVPGVRFVDSMRIRERGATDWRVFAEAALSVGPDQILRLQDDPDRAAMGILSVRTDRAATGGA